ncbi:MAG TPA: preprotein translocase subunit SecE [Candidatus Moranbacteria bacterium]|nr:preprotein translocase subunit SecE [Candidatus Moranbacteria bacterium]
MTKLIAYVKESYAELKKVTWPTKEQVMNYTMIVIVTSIIFAVILGVMDLFFSKGIEKFIF